MEQLRNMFSPPMSEQNQDPQTAPFANRLRGIHQEQNMVPTPSQDSASPYSIFKEPYTHNMHQEAPQGSDGLGQ